MVIYILDQITNTDALSQSTNMATLGSINWDILQIVWFFYKISQK